MGKRKEYAEKILMLLQNNDIRDLTMEQIAESLNITKRTLYNYYDDKRAMIKEVMDYHIDNSMAYVNMISEDDTLDAVTTQTTLIKFTINDHRSHSPNFVKSVYDYYPEIFDYCDAASRQIIQDFFLKNVEKGRREGLYRVDFHVEIIANLIFYAIEHFRELALRDIGKSDFKDAFIEVTICILRGIVSPAGSEILEREIKNIYNR